MRAFALHHRLAFDVIVMAFVIVAAFVFERLLLNPRRGKQ